MYQNAVKLKYCELLLQFKIAIFFIFFCDGKAEFSGAIIPVFSVAWCFLETFLLIIYYYFCGNNKKKIHDILINRMLKSIEFI